jgi:hypothetical protein
VRTLPLAYALGSVLGRHDRAGPRPSVERSPQPWFLAAAEQTNPIRKNEAIFVGTEPRLECALGREQLLMSLERGTLGTQPLRNRRWETYEYRGRVKWLWVPGGLKATSFFLPSSPLFHCFLLFIFLLFSDIVARCGIHQASLPGGAAVQQRETSLASETAFLVFTLTCGRVHFGHSMSEITENQANIFLIFQSAKEKRMPGIRRSV